ncbi:MAG: phospho-sugar mutase [Bacteroidetes bacterium]|nr:phospho-sugar mutase [Bacteroidota bacterium]
MVDPVILQRAQTWLDGPYDDETKAQIQYLIEKDHEELTDAFYRDLEFGTGGLRGIMGAGTNRMNKYTVGMATQGLANYIKQMFPGQAIKVAIAHDSRNNSRLFAGVTANVFTSNGFLVYLFDDLRPTPELSFAIRQLGCQSGVNITASHNPKEYNGYKVYWNDGGQLVSPHDTNVIKEVLKIQSPAEVDFSGNPDKIRSIGKEIDEAYIEKLVSLSLSPEIIQKFNQLKIVYSPLHGAGTRLIPESLKAFGFRNVMVVEEQRQPDGNFPTVKSPNPEEREAMSLALKLAVEKQADLILATDPDADRVGVGVRNPGGEYILLNGNQTATLLIYYLLIKWQEKGLINGKQFIAKTIVTSELLKKIAGKYGVSSFDVLTGFKYIAEIILSLEGKMKFIGGGEESYGLLVGDFVRDKDAVIACCMIAETAAWAYSQGKTFYELLMEIYIEFGFYKETLLSVTKKGKSGAEEIQQLMDSFRNHPPSIIYGKKVVCIKDYKYQISKDLVNNVNEKIELPASNVLQFFLDDGSKITVRPSGTEPKIKYYFGVVGTLTSKEAFNITDRELQQRIDGIIEELKLK